MVKISVVVSVYNKELYLETCVRSILNQTFSDIEVILVNDGSSDNSMGICNDFQKEDSRVRVVHQKNQGVSAARNTGLGIATGDFINFIDSDDFLELDMLELLYNNALKFSSDVSICGINSGKNTTENLSEQAKSLTRDEAIIGLIDCSLSWGAYNKLFKKELAKSEKFVGSINEDLYYCFRLFQKSANFVFHDLAKYNYAVNDNSVSMSRFDERYMQITLVAEKIMSAVVGESEVVVEAAQYNDVIANISIANLILLSKQKNFEKELEEARQNLTKNHSFIISNKKVIFKHRLAYRLIRFSPYVYKFFLKMYSKITDTDIVNRV